MTPETERLIQATTWLREAREAPSHHMLAALARLDAGPGKLEKVLLWTVVARSASEMLQGDDALRYATLALGPALDELDRPLQAEVAAACSAVLMHAGNFDAARAALDHTQSRVGVRLGAVLDATRSALAYKEGDLRVGYELATHAIDSMPADRLADRARACNTRAVIGLYLGDLELAREDFNEAERLFRSCDQRSWVADVRHNRAMLHARLGDLPAALKDFDGAETALVELGKAIDQQVVYRAEICSLYGLAEDVVETVPPAVIALQQGGLTADASEGQLYLAIAYLALDDHRRAQDWAEQSARSFERAERHGWLAIAEDLLLQINDPLATPRVPDLDRARRVADDLDRHGMRLFAASSWLRIAHSSFRQGDSKGALAALDRVTSTSDSLVLRLAAHEAGALRSVIAGNLPKARRAILAGHRLLERHRLLFDATELQAQAAAWGAGLNELDISLAWKARPQSLFNTAERWRATALGSHLGAPRADPVLTQLLARYRLLQSGVEADLRNGAQNAERSREVRKAERNVTTELRSRRNTGSISHNPPPVTMQRLRPHLGATGVVQLIEHRGEVAAVVGSAGRTSTIRLGSLISIQSAAGAVRRGLRQLAPIADEPGGRLIARGVRAQLGQLTALLATPLLPALSEAEELLVVPSRGLQALPWAALIGRGRPLSVSPSASAWLHREQSIGPRRGMLAVAGPDLVGANEEVLSIAQIHPTIRTVSGPTATVSTVAEMMMDAVLVHIAAHALFRAANPLFSHIRLADGPLTAHDLDQLHSVPPIMILSACSTAAASTRAGGELLGLSTVLLARGASCLVVANSPLPDLAIVPLMERLHRGLRAGGEVAASLAAASEFNDPEAPIGLLERCAFSAFGRGDARLPRQLTAEA